VTLETERRSLIRNGFRFIVIAFILGIGIIALPHPGRWLAAHLTALLTGPILIGTGLAWRELRLTDGQRRLGYRCGLISAYAGLTGGVYGAILNLPGPASNPGVAAPMPQAAIFFAILAIVVPTLFIAFGLALYGMRGDSAR
jgi:hypothetical protein